jgi:hypothetical protein
VGAEETAREVNEDGVPYVGQLLIKYRTDTGVNLTEIEDFTDIVLDLERGSHAGNQSIGDVSFLMEEDLSNIVPGLVVVSVYSEIPFDDVIALLEGSPFIEYVELNYEISLGSTEQL